MPLLSRHLGQSVEGDYNLGMQPDERSTSSEYDRAASDVAWDAQRLASPHTQQDKSRRVRRMFDGIAPTYELVNSVFSAGRDKYWRREMVRLAVVRAEDVLIDVACGTGDVARAFAGAAVRPARIVGLDFSASMLAEAAARPIAAGSFVQGDALRLPLADGSATLITCAFGVRNFQDLAGGLREMYRVLAPGGRAVILEFTLPRARWLRALYLFYFRRVMPLAASLISRDRSGAYRYLPSSVVNFAESEEVLATLAAAGFKCVAAHPRTCGIVSIYLAAKHSGGPAGT